MANNSIEGLTLREIGYEIGVDHPQKIQHHLNQLEKKGYLRKEEKGGGYITLDEPVKGIINLPLYGMAQCGHSELVDITATEKVSLPSKLFNITNPESMFLVQAQGISMNPRINDGDYILIKKQPQPDYQNQTCLVVHNDTAKIKNLVKTEKSFVLLSSNPNFEPVDVELDDQFLVHGVVKSLIVSY
ncbi:hypothetical protein HC766_02150 [Candidatus Gracilibacteria bacterium]|nr:hypothetical protein [Candidatus Gracilibacteria bacterium]